MIIKGIFELLTVLRDDRGNIN